MNLPKLFGDHMVLQRRQPVPVWGQAEPGAEIRVSFREHRPAARADAEGRWRVELPEMEAGAPAELRIQAGDQTITLTDVRVGEVWLCGGQSNMQMALKSTENAEAEIAAADFPDIRILTVKTRHAPQPREDVEGVWQICTPETAPDIPAVPYFFARKLWQELKVPVGLISANQGGTCAEAWMPAEAFTAYPGIVTNWQAMMNALREKPDLEETILQQRIAFGETIEAACKDWPLPEPELFDPGFADTDWTPQPPGSVFMKEACGRLCIRTVFTLTPAQAEAEPPVLHLGRIKDFDSTYINGLRVGGMGREDRWAGQKLREYPLARGVLRPGKNVLLIQVFNWYNHSFFAQGVEAPALLWPTGERVRLPGDWRVKITADIGRRPEDLGVQMRSLGGFLYNAMIAPLIPAAFRGAIWYQGESNVERAEEYRQLFADLIRTWRRLWKRGDFPFHFVQLANYSGRVEEPRDSAWAELREAQRLALAEPNTGVAVAIDTSDDGDLHPRNKKDVGERLARLTLGRTYGTAFPAPHSSPLFREALVGNGQIRLRFDHATGGLETTDSQAPRGIALAGEDGVFRWADARIEGEELIVPFPESCTPRRLRYAWADNPGVNLVNAAGLPAAPFETEMP